METTKDAKHAPYLRAPERYRRSVIDGSTPAARQAGIRHAAKLAAPTNVPARAWDKTRALNDSAPPGSHRSRPMPNRERYPKTDNDSERGQPQSLRQYQPDYVEARGAERAADAKFTATAADSARQTTVEADEREQQRATPGCRRDAHSDPCEEKGAALEVFIQRANLADRLRWIQLACDGQNGGGGIGGRPLRLDVQRHPRCVALRVRQVEEWPGRFPNFEIFCRFHDADDLHRSPAYLNRVPECLSAGP